MGGDDATDQVKVQVFGKRARVANTRFDGKFRSESATLTGPHSTALTNFNDSALSSPSMDFQRPLQSYTYSFLPLSHSSCPQPQIGTRLRGQNDNQSWHWLRWLHCGHHLLLFACGFLVQHWR